ncbi:unnamed protein product [Clonostachys rosea]|uniref:Uncharacterized protein n=1 Tax=Bionectria ochroleuca TaxID=29856 RepID=A0ABY6UJU6_BIOOC|nr:unnamed protein product [Clonostachys rosea]
MGTELVIETEKDGTDQRDDVVGSIDTSEKEPESSSPYIRIFKYAGAFELFLQAVAIFAAIGSGAGNALQNLVFGRFITIVTNFASATISPAELRDEAAKLALYFVYLGIGRFVLSYIYNTLLTYTAYRVTRNIRNAYLRAALSQDIAFFDLGIAGSIAAQATSNGRLIQGGISEKLGLTFQGLSTFVTAFVIAFVFQWKLTLICLCIAPATLTVNGAAAGFMAGHETNILEIHAQANAFAEDILSSVRTIHAFEMRDRLLSKFDGYLIKAHHVGNKISPLFGLLLSSEYCIFYLGYGLAFWQGIRMLARGEIDSAGDIFTVLLSVIIAATSLTVLAPYSVDFTRASAAAAKLFELIDRKSDIDPFNTAGEMPSTTTGHIQLENVTFAYPTRPGATVLDNFSLDFPAGKVTALVGQSGSGKSTIVGLVERWYNPQAGIIKLDGKNIDQLNLNWLRKNIRLVQQEPVLFQGTVFDNIKYGLVGTQWEHAPAEEQMKQIEEASKLAFAHDFITKLPQGYCTQIGERGGLLSGGQKQRVAIARSIVSKPKVLLLDEATSALDPEAESIVQKALDRVSEGRTTIVIAHKLATIQKADNIVVMTKGRIVEQGTHQSLIAHDGTYARLVKIQDLTKSSDESGTSSDVDDSAEPAELVHTLTRKETSEQRNESVPKDRDDYDQHEQRDIFSAIGRILLDTPELGGAYTFIAFGCLIAGGTFPGQAILLSNMMGVFSLTGSEMEQQGNFYAKMFIVLAFGCLIAYFAVGYAANIVAQGLSHKFRKSLLHDMLRQDLQFFDRDENNTGALVSRIDSNPQSILELMGYNISLVLVAILNITTCSILAIAYSWKLGLVVVCSGLPPLVAAGYMKIRFDAKIDRETSKLLSSSASIASEAITSIRTVSSLAIETSILSRYTDELDSASAGSKRPVFTMMICFAFTQSIEYWFMALGFWYGCRLLSYDEISMYAFFVAFLGVFFSGQAAAQLFQYSTSITKGVNAANYIFWLQGLRPTVQETDANRGNGPDSDASYSTDNMYFSYPLRPDTRVLKGIDLQIKKGQFVAFVGASGCGKSTMIALLQRFYDPSSGSINSGSSPLTSLNPRLYRRMVALVQQEPKLFQGSIRENIALGIDEPADGKNPAGSAPTPSDEMIESALRAANRWDFVSSLPEGLSTLAGSNGTQLSGGQRQRIAIARALIRNPKVLLLDEATSALDTESERVVQAALAKAAHDGDRVTIAVAHRLSTIKDANAIYVFHGGKIKEMGTHQELISQGGMYRKIPQADDAFGPVVAHCRQGFDFTLLFEQFILSAVPSVLVLLVSSWSLMRRYRRSVKTTSQSVFSLKLAKQISIASLAATQLVLIVLWSLPSSNRTKASLPAVALSLAGTLAMAILSYLEHDRSVRPSTILCAYLFFSALLDLSQARTLWLRQSNDAVAAVFTAGLALKVVTLIVETVEKKSFLQAPYRDYNPETLGSVFNISVFWWLNSLFLKGSSTSLGIKDLFELDENMLSAKVHSIFRQRWTEQKEKSLYRLLWVAVRSAWRPLLISSVTRLILIPIKFAQPLLIDRAVSLMSEPESQMKTNSSRAIIGATALIYLGIAVVTGYHRHNLYRFVTILRGGLVCLIYDATLKLDMDQSQESAAVTLMSADVDRIALGFESLDPLWAGPIEIGIGIYLLYQRIGALCVTPVVLAVVLVAICFSVGKTATSAQKVWVEAMQRRVAATAKALANIKGLKMTGLTSFIDTELHGLRNLELKKSRRIRFIICVTAAISTTTLPILTTITIMVYVLVNRNLPDFKFDSALVFTMLSLISLLARPVQDLAFAIPDVGGGIGCLQRIQKYLLAQEEVQESASTPPVPTSSKGIELEDRLSESGIDALIKIQNADFTFQDESKPVLNNISLKVPKGSWTILAGPVGSGKSALLLAILGELRQLKGSVHKSKLLPIAFCAQEPWLPNTTLREIVTGFSEYDANWYSKVTDACVLSFDIKELAKGDQTVIGSGGISLSGGQQQRLGLARALYSRKPLLLLDDVLCGLDPTTEQKIVDNVFGQNGLCRKNGTTVFLATHSVRHAMRADHAIVLASGGTILEQGKPSQLSSLEEYSTDPKSDESPATSPAEANVTDQGNNAPDTQEHEEIQDSGLRSNGDMRLFGYYLQAIGWVNVLGIAIFSPIFAFSFKFPTVVLNWWTVTETEIPGAKTNLYLAMYCLLAVFTVISVTMALVFLLIFGMPRASIRIHRRLLDAVIGAPFWFFVSTDSGQTMNRFSQDLSLIDVALPPGMLNTIYMGALCIMEVGLIAMASKWALPMYPVLFIVLYLLQSFYLRTSRQLRLLDIEAKSPLFSQFMETLQGLMTIRAFKWQQKSTEKVYAFLDDSQRPFYLLYSIQRWLTLVLDVMVAVIATAVVALATQTSGSSAGGLGVSLVNVLSLSQTLVSLVRAWVEVETSLGAVARVRNFERETPRERLPVENLEPPEQWPSSGRIEVRGLGASYKPEGDLVLKDLDVDIQPGEKIGLCGRTGSGKSSFVLSLLKMVELQQGDILVDDSTVKSMPRSTLRRRLNVMPQNPLILSGTIRFCLDPWSENSDERIIWALEEVGMWEVITERGGLDVNTDDCPLSRGQQQLICLSRALLGKSKILILDEATANLDQETEAKMMEVIKKNFSQCTVIMVAHHLHTIRDFDKIMVLDRGSLVEYGRPDDLLSRPSRFRDIWESQS